MFKFNGVKRITNKENDIEIYEKVEESGYTCHWYLNLKCIERKAQKTKIKIKYDKSTIEKKIMNRNKCKNLKDKDYNDIGAPKISK